MRDSASKVGQSSKLRQIWKGPYLITKVILSTLYRIRDRKVESVIHHDRLKLCRDRTVPMWMQRLWHQLLEPGASKELTLTPEPVMDSDFNLDMLFQDGGQDATLTQGEVTAPG